MIVDRSALAGAASYLRPASGIINLAGITGAAVSAAVNQGETVHVAGITLMAAHDDLGSLMARRANRLFSIGMRKEIFPGLFTDPYAHRVHRIAGFDDFGQGTMLRLRPLEVDGGVALVSTEVDAPCRWTSTTYRMPGPVEIEAVAWEMPTSRLTLESAFRYSVTLRYWRSGENPATATPQRIELAADATPRSPRFAALASTVKASAYQLVFEAAVAQDAVIAERHATAGSASLGRPLLTAIHLLEPVGSAFDFWSLAEVIDRATWCQVFNDASGAPVRLVAQLPFTAVLAAGESVFVHAIDTSAGLARLEVRLAAELQMRPPHAAVED